MIYKICVILNHQVFGHLDLMVALRLLMLSCEKLVVCYKMPTQYNLVGSSPGPVCNLAGSGQSWRRATSLLAKNQQIIASLCVWEYYPRSTYCRSLDSCPWAMIKHSNSELFRKHQLLFFSPTLRVSSFSFDLSKKPFSTI